ncbi:MAG: peptidyl-tRNA hydrolase Pth2 [Pseudomonadales bacterium]
MKQVILVNESLKLPRGKLAAQVAHASVASLLSSSEASLKAWLSAGMPKVVLAVDTEEELVRYFENSVKANIPAELIKDAGKTVVAAGTVTCVGIGPGEEAQINRLTGDLKLLS